MTVGGGSDQCGTDGCSKRVNWLRVDVQRGRCTWCLRRLAAGLQVPSGRAVGTKDPVRNHHADRRVATPVVPPGKPATQSRVGGGPPTRKRNVEARPRTVVRQAVPRLDKLDVQALAWLKANGLHDPQRVVVWAPTLPIVVVR